MSPYYQARSDLSEPKPSSRFAGIHLSGASVQKSSVVILDSVRGLPGSKLQLKLVAGYHKIGTDSKVFSDDRILGILSLTGPFGVVMVDCPTTVPPCIACTRPVCPGAIKCEDVSVAVMLSMSSSELRTHRRRRLRPLNPQSQRLWDVLYAQEHNLNFEPTYSSNAAPLVNRARTLQRRLNSLSQKIELQETSVALALQRLAPHLGLEMGRVPKYRNFEAGLKIREEIIAASVKSGLLHRSVFDLMEEEALFSVEGFQALVCAMVAGFQGAGMCDERPNNYIATEGWVYLPSQSFV